MQPKTKAERAPGVAVHDSPRVLPATPSRRVLLAKDNEVNNYIFTAMLAGEDLAIDLAPNGLAALEMLRHQACDIAFIDVQMPGLDGLSLTRQWRTHERQAGLATLPTVSLTARAFASDVQASLDAGSNLHLAKPFSRQQLLEALNRLAPAARASAATSSPTEANTLFYPVQARQRLGSELAAHQRSRAQAAAETAQARALADDLLDVAMRLGASGLVAQAVLLRAALASGDPPAVQAAQQRVQAALAPVLGRCRRRSRLRWGRCPATRCRCRRRPSWCARRRPSSGRVPCG